MLPDDPPDRFEARLGFVLGAENDLPAPVVLQAERGEVLRRLPVQAAQGLEHGDRKLSGSVPRPRLAPPHVARGIQGVSVEAACRGADDDQDRTDRLPGVEPDGMMHIHLTSRLGSNARVTAAPPSRRGRTRSEPESPSRVAKGAPQAPVLHARPGRSAARRGPAAPGGSRARPESARIRRIRPRRYCFVIFPVACSP